MNFFDHKDLRNHLLQLCPKVVKHPVYTNILCSISISDTFFDIRISLSICHDLPRLDRNSYKSVECLVRENAGKGAYGLQRVKQKLTRVKSKYSMSTSLRHISVAPLILKLGTRWR